MINNLEISRKSLIMEINQQISKVLNDTFDQTIKMVLNLSEEQLNTIPKDQGWTVGQIAEHILICSSGIPDNKTEEINRAFDDLVPAINQIFLDFNAKYEADKSLLPRQDHYNKEELVLKLKDCKTNLLIDIKDKDLMLLCKDMDFPQLGFLTRYEWLSFIAVHVQRHNHQMKENIKDLD